MRIDNYKRGGKVMGEIRPTLIIEDCSALGQISLVTATTILQAMGETTALLPTSLLSTQTEGFGKPARLATDEWLKAATDHWRTAKVLMAGALVGYLGTKELVTTLQPIINQVAGKVIIDPVMADQGELYPGIPRDYPQAMRKLCTLADIITPNWTELCLLTEQVVGQPSIAKFKQAIQVLRQQGISAQVVVTGVVQDAKIGYWVCQGGHVKSIAFDYFPGHFYGTGDAFTALLYGFLKRYPLEQAIQAAGTALERAVRETSCLPEDERRYGIQLSGLIAYLTRKE